MRPMVDLRAVIDIEDMDNLGGFVDPPGCGPLLFE
jgi:hypothetical protein